MRERPTETERSRLLARALAANAAFSGLSGVGLLVAAGPVAGWLGVDEPGVLRVLGVGLLAFGAGLLFLARAERPSPRLVLAASGSDFAWVAGSAVLLVGFPDLLTSDGRTVVAAVAVVVAALGAAQLIGLRGRLSPGIRRPRIGGALWLGAWGLLAASILFLVPALERGPLALVLFVLLPGLSALPAGALVGPALLDSSGGGPWKAAGLGILAAVLAHLVFAPLFALGLWAAAPGGTDVPGLWLATVAAGLPATGAVTLPAGALAGWLLHRLGRWIG